MPTCTASPQKEDKHYEGDADYGKWRECHEQAGADKLQVGSCQVCS